MGDSQDSTPGGASTAWREAATDLGLSVVAPFTLSDAGGQPLAECVALVRGFGSTNGVVLLDPASGEDEVRAAESSDYFVSRINASAYSVYDRALFEDTLNDWGWFGSQADRPAWYTGHSWT